MKNTQLITIAGIASVHNVARTAVLYRRKQMKIGQRIGNQWLFTREEAAKFKFRARNKNKK